jgi:hypothetical protein
VSRAASLPPELLVGVFFLPAEAASEALAEGGTARLALPALRGELVFGRVEVEVEAGELVGGVGKV